MFTVSVDVSHADIGSFPPPEDRLKPPIRGADVAPVGIGICLCGLFRKRFQSGLERLCFQTGMLFARGLVQGEQHTQ